jgi:hypothetical protein
MISRLSLVRPAVRPALKARMMLAAPYGAGKTRTALMIARELAEGGPVLGIDTEKESMLTYADEFTFQHLPWSAPFAPAELTDTLAHVEDYAVVIIDSATHFWNKEGGILEIADGKFGGWKVARPVQEDLVKAMLHCPAHLILCVRSKMAYSATTNAQGKQVIERLGVEPQQDQDLGYELNVALDMSMDHTITVTKTRCRDLPINLTFRPGEANVKELARIYREWLAGGEPLLGRAEATALIEMFDQLPGKEDRKVAKRLFVEAFARPEMLKASQLDDAERWVKEYIERGGSDDGARDEPQPDTEEPPPFASGPSTASSTTSTTTDGATSAEPVDHDPEPPDAYGEVIERVKALSVVEVTRQLAERGLDQSGNPDTKRARLTRALVGDEPGAGPDALGPVFAAGNPPENMPETMPADASSLARATEIVEPMSDIEVVEGLTSRSIPSTGNKAARRLRLTTAIARELDGSASGAQGALQPSNGSATPSVPDEASEGSQAYDECPF